MCRKFLIFQIPPLHPLPQISNNFGDNLDCPYLSGRCEVPFGVGTACAYIRLWWGLLIKDWPYAMSIGRLSIFEGVTPDALCKAELRSPSAFVSYPLHDPVCARPWKCALRATRGTHVGAQRDQTPSLCHHWSKAMKIYSLIFCVLTRYGSNYQWSMQNHWCCGAASFGTGHQWRLTAVLAGVQFCRDHTWLDFSCTLREE